MRILHFFKTYWPDSFGGIERSIQALASGAARAGAEVEVLSLSTDPGKNSVVFRGHRASKARLDWNVASTGISLEGLSRFRSAAADADIVHYHFPWPFMDLAHVLVRHGKPSVVSYHSDVVRQKVMNLAYAPLRSAFLGSVDRVVATSPNYVASSRILTRLGDKVRVIPLGLDAGDYPVPSDQVIEGWKERFPSPFFLFVGEFRYYKGIDVLLRAARSVDADIVLVGDGPENAGLRQLADSLSCSNVHFVGRVDDMNKAALLKLAAGFVFPSNQRSEAFGLSLVEAAMFSKAMVSCEIGTGTSYVNLDGQTGFVVPPSDPGALALALNRLLADRRMAHAFGQSARARYERHFRSERMVEQYLRLYGDLLK